MFNETRQQDVAYGDRQSQQDRSEKRVPIPAMERSRVPAVRTINDDSKTISVPKRRDNKGTNGDRHAVKAALS